MTRAGRRACKKDANHADVVAVLRAAGFAVLDLAAYGCPVDLAVRRPCWQQGKWVMLEVKASDRARLTPTERQMIDDGQIVVVTSGEDALEALDPASAYAAERRGEG